jgi:hypothetical protein
MDDESHECHVPWWGGPNILNKDSWTVNPFPESFKIPGHPLFRGYKHESTHAKSSNSLQKTEVSGKWEEKTNMYTIKAHV